MFCVTILSECICLTIS